MYHMSKKNVDSFRKISLRHRPHTNYKTLKIHKKNSSVKVAETSYVYVSKGSLSIGEIKFWGKVARGGLFFVKCLRAHIRDHMEILHIYDVSYVQKKLIFFEKIR